jgi:hypothetical protein
MPFINGRFYMNPAYGRAIERARRANQIWSEEIPGLGGSHLQEQVFWSDNSPRDSQQRHSGEHWITIDGHHVLIEGDGEQHSQRDRGRQRQRATRERIANIAKRYAGSTDRAYATQKGNFARNTNKCNKFVYDVTKEAGAEATYTGKDGK